MSHFYDTLRLRSVLQTFQPHHLDSRVFCHSLCKWVVNGAMLLFKRVYIATKILRPFSKLEISFLKSRFCNSLHHIHRAVKALWRISDLTFLLCIWTLFLTFIYCSSSVENQDRNIWVFRLLFSMVGMHDFIKLRSRLSKTWTEQSIAGQFVTKFQFLALVLW